MHAIRQGQAMSLKESRNEVVVFPKDEQRARESMGDIAYVLPCRECMQLILAVCDEYCTAVYIWYVRTSFVPVFTRHLST